MATSNKAAGEAKTKYFTLLYPAPKQAPDVPYYKERKENPAVRGYYIFISALLLENLSWLRRLIWRNTGFANLRLIREYLEYYEPRCDPTVPPASNEYVEDVLRAPLPDSVTKPFETKPEARYYTVADYQALYTSGDLTPMAVAKAILPLIRRDTVPSGSHSIGWFNSREDLVLKAAEASTLRYKENRPLGPLDGVPVGIKDEYDIEGYTTSLGSVNDYTGTVPPGESISGWCVKKLQEAGAMNMGKLSMHEFGLDTSGNNPIHGTPTNPYNPTYYTGGSSSGCAYAVASGLIPVALGGDGGGSIRIPAAFCSVFGLKPSHGRLSFKPCMNHSSSCAVNGPLASDMSSLAAIYQVLGTADPTSPFPGVSPLNLQPSTQRSKILGIPEVWFEQATPATQRLCRSLLDRLVSEHGYTLVPIEIPFLPQGQLAHAMTVLTDAATLLPITKNLTSANRIMIALGTVTPSTDYLLAQKLRQLLMQHLAYLWKQHPGMILVTPTTSCAGWPIGKEFDLKYGISDGDRTLLTMEYVWMANFAGLPALTVPAGFVVPEGKFGKKRNKKESEKSGEIAGEDVEGKIPVGLMGMGEWACEDDLLAWGVDAEGVGMERRCRPPIWVDVVQKAREEMLKVNGNGAH